MWALLRTRLAGWAAAGALAAVMGIAMYVQHSGLTSQLERERTARAHVETTYAEASARAHEAARVAVEGARMEERKAWERLVEQEREGSERLREIAEEAAQKADEARRRLEEERRRDPSCDAWLKEKVKCPVR